MGYNVTCFHAARPSLSNLKEINSGNHGGIRVDYQINNSLWVLMSRYNRRKLSGEQFCQLKTVRVIFCDEFFDPLCNVESDEAVCFPRANKRNWGAS